MSENINIYVDTIYNSRIEIKILLTDSIEYLKSIIQDKIGVHPDCQYLYFNDKYVYDDKKCLYDYDLKNNCIIIQKLYIY
jgi:hypothetical protein